MFKKPNKSALLRAFFRANPHAKPSEVMKEFECDLATVYRAKKQVKRESGVPELPIDGPEKNKEADKEAVVSQILSSSHLLNSDTPPDIEMGDLTPDEMRKVLASIIRDTRMPPNVRIAAISAKQKLDFETQDIHQLGPGPPVTREGAVDRLSLLMKAVGLDIVDAAISLAFGKADAKINGQLQEKKVDESEPPAPPSQASP